MWSNIRGLKLDRHRSYSSQLYMKPFVMWEPPTGNRIVQGVGICNIPSISLLHLICPQFSYLNHIMYWLKVGHPLVINHGNGQSTTYIENFASKCQFLMNIFNPTLFDCRRVSPHHLINHLLYHVLWEKWMDWYGYYWFGSFLKIGVPQIIQKNTF